MNRQYDQSRLVGMSTAEKLSPISIDDYLAGELDSRVKHEYMAGLTYAMTGATNRHNLIASNRLIACWFAPPRQTAINFFDCQPRDQMLAKRSDIRSESANSCFHFLPVLPPVLRNATRL